MRRESRIALLAGCAVVLILTHALPAGADRGLQVTSETTPKRRALVIGNQHYPKAPLLNAERDARDVARKLQEMGFEVRLKIDVSLKDLSAAVDEYLGGLGPGDASFFYYSGHGVQVKGENFLVPVDFDAKREADVPFTAYAAERLVDGVDEKQPQLSVVVLDACRNNPFKVSRGGGGGLSGMNPGSGTLIAFATGPGHVAQDGEPGKNGVYTGSLLRFLDQPGLEVRELFFKVQEDVASSTGRDQVPWVASNVLGQHFLKPGERRPDPSAATVVAMAPPPSRLPDTALHVVETVEGQENTPSEIEPLLREGLARGGVRLARGSPSSAQYRLEVAATAAVKSRDRVGLGMLAAEATATAELFMVGSDRSLLSLRSRQTAYGANRETAIREALKKAGTELADSVLRDLKNVHVMIE